MDLQPNDPVSYIQNKRFFFLRVYHNLPFVIMNPLIDSFIPLFVFSLPTPSKD